MTDISFSARRARRLPQLTVALVLALAVVAIGPSKPGGRLAAAQTAAQPPDPCGLVTTDEVHALAPKEPASNGVPNSIPAMGSSSCRYMWGTGNGRYVLTVSVDPASRMFVGMNPDAIKQGLLSSVVAGTADAVIPDVGSAAVFKAESPAYVKASAYVKERILQVTLDGLDAGDEKGEIISLLKSAASRL
jgi:hypothetical protein